jgi:hypothetical protein
MREELMLKPRTVPVVLSAIGIGALALILIWAIGWLHRPIPISVDDPAAGPIKDLLARSEQLENTLFCVPKSDVSVLDEVYVNSPDYPSNQDGKLLIAKYLGENSSSQPGYLNFRKAYHLWWRSDDPYPRQSPAPTPAPKQSATPVPTSPPMHDCVLLGPQPELIFRSIAIREERAVVEYIAGSRGKQAILVKLDGHWRVADVRVLWVSN